MNGTCALCSKKTKLKDSHLMPKAIYRVISKGFPEYGQDIIIVNGISKSAAYTDRQVKKHLLCESCELKFSQSGENKVIPLMAHHNRFTLAKQIKKFKKIINNDDETWCLPPNDETAKNFMYFSISIIWRLSVTDWSAFGLPKTKNLINEDSMNTFSNFLQKNSIAPDNTYLAVYVDNQVVDTPLMTFPTVKNHDGYQLITFNIPGIKIKIITGNNLPFSVRELYSVNKANVYFVSRSLKSHPDHYSIVNLIKNEIKAKGRLNNIT